MTQSTVHDDEVTVTDAATSLLDRLPLGAKIAVVVVMPLFLIATFIFSFVGAGANPTPYEMPVTLAGPGEQTEQLADQIADETDEDAFSFTFTTKADAAKEDVESRESVGAIVIGEQDVTVYTASAAGAGQAALVKQVGAEVAQQLEMPMTSTDVAAPVEHDAGGMSVFFFLIVCTLATFLTVVILALMLPTARLGAQLGATAVASILGPIIGFFIISTFVGDFGVTFGSITAVLGVGMLYAFTVGVLTLTFARLAGLGGVLIGMILLIAASFPSSGGATSAALLPPFWQGVHDVWIGSAALEWTRGIVYFDGAQVEAWAGQLLTWTAVGIILLTAVSAWQWFRTTRKNTVSNAGPGEQSTALSEEIKLTQVHVSRRDRRPAISSTPRGNEIAEEPAPTG
ncbi:ABC transporter permease [Paramicrobacterium chengjingii]|uniref:ABC transporter permease n=1 Tax=Paramicrobacterium chengjingii TaxID=2769067 RepID=UPI00141EC3C5|nr:ABC transporter permease [Microbacterium chengjingii]